MKTRQWIVVGAVLLAGGGAAHAQKYGAAGCGLGAVVLGNDPGAIQIVAATLNGISLNQTFGILSGTLECGQESSQGVKKNAQIYIEGNREVLARDIARGEGDTIVGLAAIAGCKDTAKVGSTLQSRYEAIFPTDKVPSEQVTDSILEALKSDATLQCQQLG